MKGKWKSRPSLSVTTSIRSPTGLPVPVLDALVRDWIESKLDPDIARSVVMAEPRMREDVTRIAQRLVKKQPSSEQPDTGGKDWAWAR